MAARNQAGGEVGRYLVVRDRSRKGVGDPGLQALKLLEGLLL